MTSTTHDRASASSCRSTRAARRVPRAPLPGVAGDARRDRRRRPPQLLALPRRRRPAHRLLRDRRRRRRAGLPRGIRRRRPMGSRDGPLLRRPRRPTRPGRHPPHRGLPPRRPARRRASDIRSPTKKATHREHPLPRHPPELERQGIELPSWAFGNSGTRFRVCDDRRHPARSVREDRGCRGGQRVHGLAPSVALHIPWDKVDDYDALRRHAEDLGVRSARSTPTRSRTTTTSSAPSRTTTTAPAARRSTTTSSASTSWMRPGRAT